MTWKLELTRIRQDRRDFSRGFLWWRTTTSYFRTVSTYRVWHDDKYSALWGCCVEPGGPGDNSRAGNDKCIEAGVYPLKTHDGERYLTIGYADGLNHPRPAIELMATGHRGSILFHPGQGFLSSIGCINPSSPLVMDTTDIDYADSRARVLAVIEDLRAFLGKDFPDHNGIPIPGAYLHIIDR
jgi:hypothetical protein